jgi:hypothetical protein
VIAVNYDQGRCEPAHGSGRRLARIGEHRSVPLKIYEESQQGSDDFFARDDENPVHYCCFVCVDEWGKNLRVSPQFVDLM